MMKKKNRQESGAPRANRIKRSLQLGPNFSRHFGDWLGKETSYQKYTYRGFQIKLRFSDGWTAICPKLGVEIWFCHQPSQDIQALLNAWIDRKIGGPKLGPQALIMQSTLAAQHCAKRHNVSLALASEILLERGF